MKILLFFLVFSSIEGGFVFGPQEGQEEGQEETFKAKKEGWRDDMQVIFDWLDERLNNEVTINCGLNTQEERKEEDLLVRHVECKENGAIQHYEFTGKFVKGKLNGEGKLKIKENAPKQERCIAVQESLFGLPAPDLIEGTFLNGKAKHMANVSWTEQRIKMNVDVTHGFVHGMLKMYNFNNGRWLITIANQNKIDGPCWIISDDEVWHTHCVGINDIKDYATIFYQKRTLLVTTDFQNKTNPTLVETAMDAEIKGKPGSNGGGTMCIIDYQVKVLGFKFEFNLITKERTPIKLNEDNLCQEGHEETEDVSKYFVNYMDHLETLPYNQEPFEPENAVPFISNIEHETGNEYELQINLDKQADLTFRHYGDLDARGRFHGYTILEISQTGVNCVRGKCQEIEIDSIRGNFEYGHPTGLFWISMNQEHQFTVFKIKENGIIHGLVVTKGIMPAYGLPQRVDHKTTIKHISPIKMQGIGKLQMFNNGRLSTQEWSYRGLFSYITTRGQGYLYGPMENGKMSNDNMAYIYPFARLALVGKFVNNKMVSAQAAQITKAICKNNMLKLEFGQPTGPKFHYNLSTWNYIGDMPLVRDPYETLTVRLDISSVPNSGQGLYAARNISKDEVVAFYNGIRYYGLKESKKYQDFCMNKTEGKDENERRHKCAKYKIHTCYGGTIDISPWLDDMDIYNATLAQKVNHKFPPFINSKFVNVEHPRFGHTVGLAATEDIMEGQEIFVNYGYNVNENTDINFPWFRPQWEKHQEYMKKLQAGEDVSHLPIP